MPLVLFTEIDVIESDFFNQIVLTAKSNRTAGFSYIKFEIEEDGAIKTEVLMQDIYQPDYNTGGIEIVAIWEKRSLNSTWWYSDSSSLELVKRQTVSYHYGK